MMKRVFTVFVFLFSIFMDLYLVLIKVILSIIKFKLISVNSINIFPLPPIEWVSNHSCLILLVNLVVFVFVLVIFFSAHNGQSSFFITIKGTESNQRCLPLLWNSHMLWKQFRRIHAWNISDPLTWTFESRADHYGVNVRVKRQSGGNEEPFDVSSASLYSHIWILIHSVILHR